MTPDHPHTGPNDAPDSGIPAGRSLAHYEIVEKIGAGGMGEVYRARDTKLQRDVAIKVLPPEMASDAEKRNRFEREALAVAALKHPNVVTIHGVDAVDDLHFIVMELVEGVTLSDAIPSAGLPLDQFLEISIALTDALSAAHACGITHRDLKPANVMLDEAGRVKVLDFGLAKFWELVSNDTAMTMPADGATRAGQILGTAHYMSPEQAQGKPVDVRADVLSLGVILYEMATGKLPFEGESNISVISSILKDEPPSATTINPKLPRHLGHIITRCLAKNPEQRYENAMELRNELAGLKKELDSGKHGIAANARRAGRLPARVAVGSAAVVAILLVVFFVLGRESGRETAVPSRTTAEQATVGVIGFQNLSDPADSENLGRMLVALVTTHMAESGRHTVASIPRVLEALCITTRCGAISYKSAAPHAGLEPRPPLVALGRSDLDGAFIPQARDHLQRVPGDDRVRYLLLRRLFELARWEEAVALWPGGPCSSRDQCRAGIYASRAFAQLGEAERAEETLEGIKAGSHEAGLAHSWRNASDKIAPARQHE